MQKQSEQHQPMSSRNALYNLFKSIPEAIDKKQQEALNHFLENVQKFESEQQKISCLKAKFSFLKPQAQSDKGAIKILNTKKQPKIRKKYQSETAKDQVSQSARQGVNRTEKTIYKRVKKVVSSREYNPKQSPEKAERLKQIINRKKILLQRLHLINSQLANPNNYSQLNDLLNNSKKSYLLQKQVQKSKSQDDNDHIKVIKMLDKLTDEKLERQRRKAEDLKKTQQAQIRKIKEVQAKKQAELAQRSKRNLNIHKLRKHPLNVGIKFGKHLNGINRKAQSNQTEIPSSINTYRQVNELIETNDKELEWIEEKVKYIGGKKKKRKPEEKETDQRMDIKLERNKFNSQDTQIKFKHQNQQKQKKRTETNREQNRNFMKRQQKGQVNESDKQESQLQNRDKDRQKRDQNEQVNGYQSQHYNNTQESNYQEQDHLQIKQDEQKPQKQSRSQENTL